jgi:alanyl-tRNA synthetase
VGTVTSEGCIARVETTQKIAQQTLHSIFIEKGNLEVGKPYQLKVDPKLRRLTMRNHTATHLLHSALRLELGGRVRQAGSLVDPDRLRFDFTYPQAVNSEQLKKIEDRVNTEIQKGLSVVVLEMEHEQALKKGALAFFDEKYGDTVRVVQVGEGETQFSTELCGGTHVSNLAEIGIFKITAESSVASGVRRIEALTSMKAREFLFDRETLFKKTEEILGVKGKDTIGKIEALLQQIKILQRDNEQLKIKALQASSTGQQNKKEPIEIKGMKLFIEELEETDPKVLRALVDQLRDRGKSATLVVLFGRKDEKVSLCVGLTSDLTSSLHAGKIVQMLAPDIEGKGGGRPDFAQAGGTRPEGIKKAIESLKSWLESSS